MRVHIRRRDRHIHLPAASAALGLLRRSLLRNRRGHRRDAGGCGGWHAARGRGFGDAAAAVATAVAATAVAAAAAASLAAASARLSARACSSSAASLAACLLPASLRAASLSAAHA